MSFGIQVLNSSRVLQFLSGKKFEIDRDVTKGIRRAAIFVQGEVKESIAGRRAEKTSVDTGRFLNSVDMESSKDDAIVFSDVPHALFLENGTSRINARHHFRNSKDRNRNKITDIIAQSIKV